MTDSEVVHVDACELAVIEGAWDYALGNAAAIDARWEQARRTNPNYFNGTIYLMQEPAIRAGVLRGQFVKSEFKAFLYWRESGAGEAGAIDAFGSALIRSSEGFVLLGRQHEGHINGGRAYLPGGFIDERDVAADGRLDIEGSIRRELAEETGLTPASLDRVPGYYVTRAGTSMSIAAEFRSPLTAAELRAVMLAHIGAQADPELADIVVARSARDFGGVELVPYAATLLRKLFVNS